MAKKSNPKERASHHTQSSAFIEAARSIGCDESEEAFNANLKKVASHKPGALPPKTQKPKTRK